MSIEEFIEMYREDIQETMGIESLFFNADQEEIENFIINNETFYSLMEEEGVEF